jgi:mannose-1-phosphate guanylyltransferase
MAQKLKCVESRRCLIKLKGIILAGGSGTRLWPISRTLMPKQFVKLFDDKSLFQLTVERNSKLCESQLIATNAEQYFLAQDQLEGYSLLTTHYLLEPIGRNTAPSIALACLALDKEEIVLVAPSDHLIKNEEEYQKVVEQAKELASRNYIVTFGIKPTCAETGYGYIESKIVSSESKDVVGMDVIKFHEKPDKETAQEYLKQNNSPLTTHHSQFFWNSGMFCFKVGVFLEELQKYAPEIYDSCVIAFENKKIQNSTLRIQHSYMEAIPSESIDYAVMEKSKKVKVIPSSIGWNDLGSFDALYDVLPKDDDSNATLSTNKQYTNTPIAIDSKNNMIISDKQVAAVDIEDLIIVDTPDALLISKKGSSQKVKKIVEKLKKQNSELQNTHITTHRPWGTYTVLEDSKGYKIKKIEVKPGKRLSLQKHFHRNEHWIVVSGTATVTVGDETKLIRPNESTYIKMGEVHRLANEGKIPVVLIEAQVGEYTGEDDIVRIEDDYDRRPDSEVNSEK